MVDVVSKRCAHEGCKKGPSFGNEGDLVASYCATHKLEGMVNVVSKRCAHEGCKKIPSFGNEGDLIALYCASHKLEGMVDVKSKRCATPLCSTSASNPLYRGYCLRCFLFAFPSESVTKHYKTKEVEVVNNMLTYFPEETHTWRLDTRVEDGCSRRRPDMFLHMGTHVIIVEIDENKHRDYNTTCEQARINELFTDVYFQSIVFIRFNPDKYVTNGKVIPSCWTKHKTSDAPFIPPSQRESWQARMQALADAVQKWKEVDPASLSVVQHEYLFYDDYNE